MQWNHQSILPLPCKVHLENWIFFWILHPRQHCNKQVILICTLKIRSAILAEEFYVVQSHPDSRCSLLGCTMHTNWLEEHTAKLHCTVWDPEERSNMLLLSTVKHLQYHSRPQHRITQYGRAQMWHKHITNHATVLNAHVAVLHCSHN